MNINRFCIVTTVYNAEKYIGKCLSSILSQTYKLWNCIVIDDCSTDGTAKIIENFVQGDNRFTVIRNKTNIKAIANYVKYIPELCKDDDIIIVSLDGDDWFYDDTVLKYLNEVYSDKNIKMTYGSYICASELNSPNPRHDCNSQINSLDDLKNEGFNMSHLKTWNRGLWGQINPDDLKRWDGKFVQAAWDLPIVISLSKLCKIDQIKYIDKLLCVYNNENSISEWRVNSSIQNEENKYIRKKLL